jgi:protein O-mannosyl-transferase
MSRFYEHRFFIALLFLTAFILSPGITPSFSSDDYVHLLNNSNFTSIHDVLKIFTEPYGREYRPMVRLSLWVNSLMSHDAIPFKITNLILHLVSTALIYTLLLRLSFNITAAFTGTALFALHPIHITNIHFILGRTDLVLAVFYFSTLIIVSQWKDKVSTK